MIEYLIFLAISTATFALFGLGLNLQWGFTGLINFGHIAFMTLGAYTTVLLSFKGVPLLLSAGIGAIIAALLGLVIGFTTLRLREDYLSIVTIGTGELIRLVINNQDLPVGNGSLWELLKELIFDLVMNFSLLLEKLHLGEVFKPIFWFISLVFRFIFNDFVRDTWISGAFGLQSYLIPLSTSPNLFLRMVMIAVLTLLTGITLFSLWGWVQTAQILTRNNINRNGSIQQEFISRLIVGIALGLLSVAIYISGVIGLYNYNPKAGLMLLALLVLALVFWRLEFLVRSPWGRILKAIREDEEIPKALGKNVFWYKLQSLMLGGAIAGIAGAFFAWQLSAIYPDNFQPQLTFDAWIMVILGGSGNNVGTILGAVIYFAYDALTREFLPKIVPLDVERIGAFRIMFIGLILMVLMIWRPQGILGKKEELTLGK